MALRVVRLGSPRLSEEGLRVGTVRRPPRGVRKEDFARTISHQTNLSVDCCCEDEARWHRVLLRELLVEAGADLAR